VVRQVNYQSVGRPLEVAVGPAVRSTSPPPSSTAPLPVLSYHHPGRIISPISAAAVTAGLLPPATLSAAVGAVW
jgi:hypothetical protein